MIKANPGIFEDGFEAATFGRPPTEHDYGDARTAPHLNFQRWSWMAGYTEAMRLMLIQGVAETPQR